jgi:soluble lytic murein transglycosylase
MSLYFIYGIYEKTRYPVKYLGEIRTAATEFAVGENVVLAVIRTESGFDADAVSSKGALGLMQIMPSTGEYLYGKLYGGGFDSQKLLEAQTNIRLGTYYISYLFERFDKDILWAVAAYNAGEGNVALWREAGTGLSDIPYKETREYVLKFQKAYKKYVKINKV